MIFNYHLIQVLDVQYWIEKQRIQIVTKKPKAFYLKYYFHKVKVSITTLVYNNIIKFQWILSNSFKGIDSSSTFNVIFTYFILIELASACRCSRYMIMVLKSVTFMSIGGKYMSSVFLSSSTFLCPINLPKNKTLHLLTFYFLVLFSLFLFSYLLLIWRG